MTGQIFLNDNDRLQIDTRELASGDALDVLIVDGLDGQTKWITTTVEYNEGYYLTGLAGYSPLGLFGRVK